MKLLLKCKLILVLSIISGDDVTNGKPSPEIYNKIISYLKEIGVKNKTIMKEMEQEND